MVERSAGLLGLTAMCLVISARLSSRPGWLCAGELTYLHPPARPPLPSAEACVHLPGLLTEFTGPGGSDRLGHSVPSSLKVKCLPSSSLCHFVTNLPIPGLLECRAM